MNAQRFEVGELVDIAIRGARVVDTAGQGFAPLLALDVDGERLEVAPSASLTVTRVAPREWPPRPADVWASGDGRLWFARASEDYSYDQARMVSADPDSPSESAGTVLNHFGQMRLVYREGWSPETPPAGRDTDAAPEASAVATTGQPADMRAENIAGLREAADWLAANPDVPLDGGAYELLTSLSSHGRSDSDRRAELLRVAEVLGEEPDFGQTHPQVARRFRGKVAYRAYYVPVEPAQDPAQAGGEVAGPDSSQAGPATAANEPDHYHSGGAAGGPGDNGAQCACGTTYAGFDSHAGAMAALEQHIADEGKLPRLVQPAPINDPALTDPADDPVWVAAERKGIDYHALPSGSRTTCGRATAKGHRLRRSEAAEFGRPCQRCYPALEG